MASINIEDLPSISKFEIWDSLMLRVFRKPFLKE